jgi:hypothetical protein
MHIESQDEPQRDVELELRQARSEALLAERRYAACDPDNRLIAVQLEKSWEIAFSRVKAYQARLDAARSPDPVAAAPDFAGLANDLNAAWNAPNVTMRARQQLLRALITDIIADVDEAAREVILTIHWRCGQHSQLRVRKQKSGKHGCRTSEDALAVMRGIASRWSDEDIAASLNRMEWAPVREKLDSVPCRFVAAGAWDSHLSFRQSGEWLTVSEAAKLLGVTNHAIRQVIKEGLLAAEQVVAST